MKGDDLKVRNYVKSYGYDFVLDAIETAIDLKNAREMSRKRMGIVPTVKKREGEFRIIEMANQMKIRIGG